MPKKTNNVIKLLAKMCPKANKTSIFHLGVAIQNGYKYYCTSEKILLKKTKSIKKKFGINVISDPYVNTLENPFNFYI